MKIGNNEVATPDAVMMGAGALMLVDGFLPWYSVDLGPFGSVSVSGWSAGFAWLPILLVVVVGGAVAAKVFGGQALPPLSTLGPSGLLLAVSALGTLLVLLRLLTQSSYVGAGLVVGLVLAGAQTAFAYRSFQASGEVLPVLRARS